MTTRLQDVRRIISELENRYKALHDTKETLERAWSRSVKAGLPEIEKQMDAVLNALREAEAEEHRLTWPPRGR
jgi:hypothetical protein